MNEEKILIFIIDNSGLWPSYFSVDVVKLYNYTKSIYPNTEIQTIQANSVVQMRNIAMKYALGESKFNKDMIRFDYLVMLDIDHRYKEDFIVKFMQHNKDIVTGCTSSRKPPYIQTQYKKMIKEIKEEDNIIKPIGNELIKAEASGLVGMLIKVDVLEKITFPFCNMEYIDDEKIIGEDIFFCKKLKEAGYVIWVDPTVSFPHEIKNVFVNNGEILIQ